MVAAASSSNSVSDGKVRVYKVNGKWAVSKVGEWVGSGAAHGKFEFTHQMYEGQRDVIEHRPTINALNFSSFQTAWNTDASANYDFVVYYTVQHGVAKQDKREIGSSVMTNAWTTLNTFSVPTAKATRLTGRFRVTWNAADRGVYYGIRIVVNGSVLKHEYLNGLGPFTPLGNGAVPRSLMIDDNIPAGATVEFQARANGGGASQRTMRGAVIELGWVE